MPKLLEELKSKRTKILEIAAKHGVSNVRVFGSVARNEENEESDIDFLVTISPNVSLFSLVKLEISLKESLGRKVQIISDRAVNRHLKDKVFREATIL